MRAARAIYGVLLALLLPGLAIAGPVDVTVTGVRNANGRVLVAVCDKATFLSPTCLYHGGAAAQPGAVTVRIPDVPPGVYAIEAYHDENGNGKLDTSLLGFPKEGMGFSRNAPMRFGPPSFADAALTIRPEGAAVSFSLRYFD